MTKTTFYTHVTNPERFACRLIDKAYLSGERILIWLNDENQTEKLNQLLWSYKASSFLPHMLWLNQTPQPNKKEGIVLSYGNQLPEISQESIVLNLTDQYWIQAPVKPKRILEIVGNDIDSITQARERFRIYKQAGFLIEHFSRKDKND